LITFIYPTNRKAQAWAGLGIDQFVDRDRSLASPF